MNKFLFIIKINMKKLFVVTTTLFIASIGTLGYYANKFGKQMANNYALITSTETSKRTDTRYC